MRRFPAPVFVALTALVVLAGCSVNVQPPSPQATASVAAHSCPAWTNPPASATIPPPAQQTTAALARYAAQVVLSTPRPILNPYTTSEHPLTHRATPVPCLVRSTPRNERVGQRTQFWTLNNDTGEENQVSARLVYETSHLYMYLQDGASADLAGIKASADLFERQMFPTDERTYGAHWSPGVDDDPHTTVLNATGLGQYVGGYFSITDEFPHLVYPYSNERQIIYINLDGGEVPGDEFYNATLAHEFQHMIHWYYHPADQPWINEGMSVLAQHINGFTSGGVEQDFLAHPDTQLTTWSNDGAKVRDNYGAGYLFLDYLAEHYGGYTILKSLLTDPAQVPVNINDALQARGSSDRFDDVFAKWVIANLLNDPRVANGVYAYPTIPGETAVPQNTVGSYPYSAGQASVHQYATEYYQFNSTGTGTHTLSLAFSGVPYTTIVANHPYGGAQYEWWSNAGENIDTTLTHTFDLTHVTVRPITMTFHAWYDLAGAAAQVEISQDGGKTWTVPTVNVATGGNFCCGFSDHSGNGSAVDWEQDSIDLTPYAGKTIQVRFEAVEQGNIPPQGLTLDDIEIPAIGFLDTIASDNGWQAAGFVRVPNILPQTYIVQAVVYPTSGAPQVQRIAVDSNTGVASATFTGFGGTIDHVTLAVSAVAPTILTSAPYQLSARLM